MTLRELVQKMLTVIERLKGPFQEDRLRRIVPPILAADIRSNFEGSHDPAGNPWAPIHHRDGFPLVDTHALMEGSIAAVSNPHIDAGAGTITATQDDPFYGHYHQTGTSRIKKREFFGVSEGADVQIGDRVAEDMVEYAYGDL